jgi:archaellum component FlaF (FlaF/FlaG flagellin family)
MRERVSKYRFEIKHVTILFIALLVFQAIVSFLHKMSLQKSLANTQEWYQQDSAERLANLATTSLELLLESKTRTSNIQEADARKMVQGLNIILSQQTLHQNVQDMCILVPHDSMVYAIDEGRVLYSYMFQDLRTIPPPETPHDAAIELYRRVKDEMRRDERIHTVFEGKQTFHVFVPFVPRGEFVGAVYMKNTPDFGFITREIVSSYGETSMTFSALILLGFLAMFYISSYTLRERNEAQKLLFEKEKDHLTEQINHQKEMMFTKRIYHTHHKAEKVTGFIKEDLRILAQHNIEEVKDRVMKYTNFIARVIYDMKWYDPPVQTIRGSLFSTNVNDVVRFLVDNVFSRVSRNGGQFRFALDLDDRIPPVSVNEYVAWEAIEPIIQNCVEHSGVKDLVISIMTRYDPSRHRSTITIADNGTGLPEDLLQRNERGIRRVFEEHTTSKAAENQHSGYGCYIAREIATQRCGWELDAENTRDGGSRFTFTINHQS